MHPLHEYLAKQLGDKLRERRVVVWYDPRREFVPFINELRGTNETAPLVDDRVETVQVGSQSAALSCYAGSFFAVRAAVEPLVAVDRPNSLVVYVPGVERNPYGSVLMELELGGEIYMPQLKRQARNVLRQFHTDGMIDEMLASERLRYRDIVQLIEGNTNGGGAPSMLRVIFAQARDNATLLAAWLANEASDAAVEEKMATVELYKLVRSRLGLEFELTVPLGEARSRLLRYLLVSEFRADLQCPPPASTALIPAPGTKDHLAFLRDVVGTLRRTYADCYITHADRIEGELGLATAGVDALALGATDTFRFEEQALLHACDTLLAGGEYARVIEIERERSRNFWVERDMSRQNQWSCCRLAAELAQMCNDVWAESDRMNNKPAAWVNAYARADGWYRIDQHQRHLEQRIADMDGDPTIVQGIATVRQAHDRLAQRMADGFSKALQAAQWHIDGVRAQTHIYADDVAPHLSTSTVAYVLVDALRYEMGQELQQQLAPLGEVSCTPVAAALPTLTKIGMAALLPGAATSFDIVEDRGKLAARIDDVVLPDLVTRQKFLKARVPRTVDIELGELLQMPPKKLAAQINEAALIVVRSQDIDSLGESGATQLAHQVVNTVIGNVARAVRKLANSGVAHIVITADHGHLFAQERGDDMKIEKPVGQDVELHRRCWIGRGGSAAGGTTRVQGSELGYATDLDVIFPTGLGVFKAGGGLAYHHGGTSLQELVVPVLHVRVPRQPSAQPTTASVIIGEQPDALHTRTMGVALTLTGNLFTEAMAVRPIMLGGSEQVGYAGMAFNGEFDAATGTVMLRPGTKVHVGLLLTRDDVASVRIVVQNPATDAVLGQTDDIPVQLGL